MLISIGIISEFRALQAERQAQGCCRCEPIQRRPNTPMRVNNIKTRAVGSIHCSVCSRASLERRMDNDLAPLCEQMNRQLTWLTTPQKTTQRATTSLTKRHTAGERRTHWLALKARPQSERNLTTEGKSLEHPSAKPVQCSGCSAAVAFRTRLRRINVGIFTVCRLKGINRAIPHHFSRLFQRRQARRTTHHYVCSAL